MSQLFDKTTSALNTSLNMRLIKQNIIASNIANAETPGYHAKKIDFEDALARALDLDGMRSASSSHADHIAMGAGSMKKLRPEIYENPEGAVNNDGNTVDLQAEITNQAENQIMYQAVVELMRKKLAALRYAASDGR